MGTTDYQHRVHALLQLLQPAPPLQLLRLLLPPLLLLPLLLLQLLLPVPLRPDTSTPCGANAT